VPWHVFDDLLDLLKVGYGVDPTSSMARVRWNSASASLRCWMRPAICACAPSTRPAFLFRFSDAPVMKALSLYRDETRSSADLS
jgi:gentisate 1,2-dioxygenase